MEKMRTLGANFVMAERKRKLKKKFRKRKAAMAPPTDDEKDLDFKAEKEAKKKKKKIRKPKPGEEFLKEYSKYDSASEETGAEDTDLEEMYHVIEVGFIFSLFISDISIFITIG